MDHQNLHDLDYDVIVVGAGLASSLTALRLKARRPHLRIRLLEAAPQPDTSHTWCCFDTDLGPNQLAWIGPMMANHWPSYEVAFPARKRDLTTGYGRMTSESLNRAREAGLAKATHYGTKVKHLGLHHVILSGGEVLTAPLILDGRGAAPSQELSLAYQKFVGLEVLTHAPHGLNQPIVMDATVSQIDGYRFIYVLPLDDHRLLIEDTRYSDGDELDVSLISSAIRDYARQKGWSLKQEVRVETGILPILLDGDFESYWQGLGPAAPVGMRALLFHPTTGYSLPQAARLADLIADQDQLETGKIRELIEVEARRNWHQGRYLRLLNRMMFKAAEPTQRYLVLQRFYGLPQGLIERFYAGHLKLSDRLRILAGKPPVPLIAAFKALRSSKESPHG